MKPTSPQEVLELMESYAKSAALCVVMEVGFFWLLDENSLDATGGWVVIETKV